MTPAAKEPFVARPARAIKMKFVLTLAATAENANLSLLVPASFADEGFGSPHQRRAFRTQRKLDTASLFGAMNTDGRFAILFAVMTTAHTTATVIRQAGGHATLCYECIVTTYVSAARQ